MKNRANIFFLLLTFVVFGCSSPKIIMDHKADAEQAELAGNFSIAVSEWRKHFESKPIEEISGATFARAANTAYKAGMMDQAYEWYDQAKYKSFTDAGMYLSLANIYRQRDNLSKELEALEYYVENFEKDNDEVNKRLFEIYHRNDMNEKALAAWDRLDPDSVASESMLEKYFQINKELENTEVADSVSLELLEINPEHVKALEWNALKYYWKAENHYKREMKKYEEKKTGLQYVFLRNELKKVTADFKKALTYFDKLWEIDPGEKYAAYISNIYVRFDDDEKVKYYRKFLEQ